MVRKLFFLLKSLLIMIHTKSSLPHTIYSDGGILSPCISCLDSITCGTCSSSASTCRHCVPPVPEAGTPMALCPCGAHWDCDDPVARGWIAPRGSAARLTTPSTSVNVTVYYRPCSQGMMENHTSVPCIL